jgi:NADPH:quinone reductase-like Zn-dependent oxidoreductase
MDWQPVGVVNEEVVCRVAVRGWGESGLDMKVPAKGPQQQGLQRTPFSPIAASAGEAQALWYIGAGQADLRRAPLPRPGPEEALVRTLVSGISRGTERLVFQGLVPDSERERMRAPLQEGDFPFPVKYGYCAVGLVEQGPAHLMGRLVFALHPHQDRFVAPIALLAVLPDALPPERAVLAANMETALNALWDAGAGPADRICIVGAGVLGLLVAALAARLPGAHVIVIDTDPSRRALIEALGARFALPAHAPSGQDCVIHASASAAGLKTALAAAGREATVIELSWYGDGDVPVPLGGAFHSHRLRLISSQVSEVSPSRRPRWNHARRLAAALDLLADPRFDALITREIRFPDLPSALPDILAPGAGGLCTIVRYSVQQGE